MGIVDKVMGGLRDKEAREAIHNENASRKDDGPAALALGKPSEYVVDDKIGGTHTRNVLDAVVHENVIQHAHHEVTPIVNREREETEIHQKVQPIIDQQEHHTHHQHVAPHVSRHIQEDITEDHATKYRNQGNYTHQQTVGEQTHSTSVNAPIVREHVNRHIIEEIQPIIQRQTQRVEHHHTTQQINEVHVKAPVVHTTVTNAPITMEEFAGKAASLSLGHNDHDSSLGRSGTTTTTSGAAGAIGSRGHHSGLSNDSSSGLRNSTSSSTGTAGTAGLAGGAAALGSSGHHTGDHSSSRGLTGDHSTTRGENFGTLSGSHPTGDRLRDGAENQTAASHQYGNQAHQPILAEKAKAAVGLGHSNSTSRA